MLYFTVEAKLILEYLKHLWIIAQLIKIIYQIGLGGNSDLILIRWLLIKQFALLAVLYYCYAAEVI